MDTQCVHADPRRYLALDIRALIGRITHTAISGIYSSSNVARASGRAFRPQQRSLPSLDTPPRSLQTSMSAWSTMAVAPTMPFASTPRAAGSALAGRGSHRQRRRRNRPYVLP